MGVFFLDRMDYKVGKGILRCCQSLVSGESFSSVFFAIELTVCRVTGFCKLECIFSRISSNNFLFFIIQTFTSYRIYFLAKPFL